MALDKEYCDKRKKYCSAMHAVLDRFSEIAVSMDQGFINHVIVQSGIPKPHTKENFEDIIGETVDEFINRLFKSDYLDKCRTLVNFAQAKAPMPDEVGGVPTWNDMQRIIHEGPEQKIGLIVQYLPDDDVIKRAYLIAQANYHSIYTAVQNADTSSIHETQTSSDIDKIIKIIDAIPEVSLPFLYEESDINDEGENAQVVLA